MNILDGKKLSQKILADLKKEIFRKRLRLRLAIVLVGDDPASQLYIERKQRAGQEIGITVKVFSFPMSISQQDLKEEISKIAGDPDNNGIIVQLPLPSSINTQEILNKIPYTKDVDVLSEEALGKFCTGTLPIFPPVVSAISKLSKHYHISFKDKYITVVGEGRLVGFPTAIYFFREKGTVSVIDRETRDKTAFIKKADVVISGVGISSMIKGSMVKKGVIIFDAGTSFGPKGELRGDVDFKSVSKKAYFITPVPGGIGPMTVACLFNNLFTLSQGPN